MPIAGGLAHWSPTAITGLVNLRLRVKEGPHYLQVPFAGGPVQWSLTDNIGLVHLRLRIQEGPQLGPGFCRRVFSYLYETLI